MSPSPPASVADRYELIEQIGHGGMGTVWRAHDAVLGRCVAIKQVGMVPGGSEPDLVRAEREAHLAATVTHENVVAVYDLVHDADHEWLVMEYVDGPSLAGRIAAEGPIDAAELRPIMAQVAASLEAAHQHGIVHRDVKPSNILLTSAGVAKLSDFGVARAEADAALTQTGLVTGSPAYLAPEVVTGRSATAASDVWALGATIFHARSGHPAHDSGSDLMAAMDRIVHEAPPRLPDDDPLADVATAAMQVDPDARPTMAQVREALQTPGASLEATTTLQPLADPVLPPATPRRTGNRSSRAIWWAAAAAVVLLAVVVLPLLGLRGGGDADTITSPQRTAAPASNTTPTAAALEGFASDYLTAAANDPEQGFTQLTPAYQAESGGLDGYEDFWGDVDDLNISRVEADPKALTVSYTYSYDFKGDRRTEDVTLQLARDGDGFLIAGAS